ncbi:MAG: DUF4175 domain-containing protein [Gemmatimonadetes bacterium]|nr:DUF4175 domain-containing protein [Gemmatimonadota bacterium]
MTAVLTPEVTPRDAGGHAANARTVRDAVTRVRAHRQRVELLRAALLAVGGGAAVAVLLRLLVQVPPLRGSALFAGGSAGAALNVATVLLPLVVVTLLARRLVPRVSRTAPDAARAALFIEETARATPDAALSYAVVTCSELLAPQWAHGAGATDDTSPEALAAEAARIVARADLQAVLARRARTRVGGPLLFAAASAALLLWAVRSPSVDAGVAAGVASAAGDAAARGATAALGGWQLDVTPPAYSGQPARDLGDAGSARVLAGSAVRLSGRGDVPAVARVSGDSLSEATPTARALDGAWAVSQVVARSQAWRITRGGRSRLLVVEVVSDSIPQVTLTLPARDTVLRVATGRVPLSATLHDDVGLADAHVEVLVTSGEGERFTVTRRRMAPMTWGATAGATRDATLRGTLDLAALGLAPGDVVHVRAIARDRHPAASRESGSSETRSIRIARPSEYDSVAVEPAPPPAMDSSLLSQRMLLLLTERLDRRQAQLARSVVVSESQRIARDQSRLRQAVGDLVFQRLSGESSGEHAHFAGDGHDHGVEAQGGRLSLSASATAGMLEEGSDGPVIAVNAPLLEAYNAMWDAGRALEQGDPHAAIPPMRRALAAIEAARAASRLYLRGRPPQVIVDIARVRLTGKDTGGVSVRGAGAPLADMLAPLDARLVRAAVLAARGDAASVAAARDSLALLRLDALQPAPAFAAAVDGVLAALARAGDATPAFTAARRVLGTVRRVPPSAWSRGGPP